MPLPAVEIETRPRPTHSVIWLHGLGADGHDFAPIIPELVAREWPAIRFVFPHAPIRPVTINGGMAMRAWYDIKGTDIASRQDEAGVRESVTQVDALIAREQDRGVPAGRVFLAGFSQGGAIALAGGLRHAKRLGGIVALSTYLPIHETTEAERSTANAGLPVFMAHGSHDPIVPQPLGTRSRDLLQTLGHPVDWHTYPMAHTVIAEEIADLRQWLGARLAA
ncbi:MAG TPA: dienelactone hydrolase family protein [Tahibacter sp.]|uniref:alpha/beta hydrolase n=1 Tax=Tahibacter sp. TaxID=2056211 RepID=UPI002D0B6A01|nr:dienelactone hydrolase family protein [Tahibacter sp.]HSX61434.1 dienelactone hydrolase family protein [Tahibacter sp.]